MKNKKLVVSVLSTALVSSMAASALAAPNAGVYIGGSVDEYYSLDSFQSAANNAGAISKVLDAGIDNVLFVTEDGEVASLMEVAEAPSLAEALHEAALADFETDAYKVIKEDGTQNGTWAAKDDTDLNPDGNTGDLEVSSVSAIDAKHIQVKFSTPVLADGTANAADTITNYEVNGAALSGTDSVTISEDGKTATLNLNTTAALTNDTAYTLTVKANIVDANGKALGDTDVKSGIFFADHAAPTVSKVAAQSNGDVKITFSENVVAGTPAVIVNNVAVTPSAVVDNTVTVTKANLASAGLVNGQSYSVVVSGYNDLVPTTPNAMTLYKGTFSYTVNADVTAPSVTSLVAADEKTLTLSFNEVISGVTADGAFDNAAVLGLAIKKGTTPVAIVSATTKDGKTFTVNLDQSANVLFDSATNEKSATLSVSSTGFKDVALNVGQTYNGTVTLAKDTVAPSVVSASYDYTNSKFVFTFNEGLKADAVKTLLAAGITIIDNSTGIKLASPTAAQVDNIVAGAKTVSIDNSVATGLNLLTGSYTFNFGSDLLFDNALNTSNAVAAFSKTVSITTAGADVIKPTVTAVTPVAAGTKDTITVTFSEAVKGGSTTGSATDLANFKLNGSALPTGTTASLAAVSGGTQVLTINLPVGSTAKTQAQVLTISGVQDLAGNTILTTDKIVTLTDSAKPVLTAASVDANGALILTLSEDIDGLNNGGGQVFPVVGDFDVKVNGTLVGDAVVAAGASENQVKVTSAGTSFGTGTITVTTKAGTLTTADAAGNTLTSGTTVTATR